MNMYTSYLVCCVYSVCLPCMYMHTCITMHIHYVKVYVSLNVHVHQYIQMLKTHMRIHMQRYIKNLYLYL